MYPFCQLREISNGTAAERRGNPHSVRSVFPGYGSTYFRMAIRRVVWVAVDTHILVSLL
jgi:hypothetical protein